MKKLFNSTCGQVLCGVLIGLILVFIGVLTNRKSISGSTEKAIASVLFKNNYAQQWRREASAVAYRFAYGIDAPEIKQPLGIESRDYLRALIAKSDGRIYVLPIEKDRYERTVMGVIRSLGNLEHL